MSGLSVKLPLGVNSTDGPYMLNKTYIETVQQNFKMLLLTIPGEKIMDPLYGVGLYRYLFELKTSGLSREINKKISEQVSRYMPFLELTEIFMDTEEESNSLFIKIRYRIVPFDLEEILMLPL